MMTIKVDNIDTECSFSQVQSYSRDMRHKSFSVLRLINTLQSSLSDRILNLQILQFVITHQGNDLFSHSISNLATQPHDGDSGPHPLLILTYPHHTLILPLPYPQLTLDPDHETTIKRNRNKDALLTPLGTTYSEPSKDLEELEEVHLITSVLCLIAAHDFSSVKGDGDVGLPDSSVRGFEVSRT